MGQSFTYSGCIIEVDHNVLVLCMLCYLPSGRLYIELAALHSDHYRQVPLVGAGCFRQVAAGPTSRGWLL